MRAQERAQESWSSEGHRLQFYLKRSEEPFLRNETSTLKAGAKALGWYQPGAFVSEKQQGVWCGWREHRCFRGESDSCIRVLQRKSRVYIYSWCIMLYIINIYVIYNTHMLYANRHIYIPYICIIYIGTYVYTYNPYIHTHNTYMGSQEALRWRGYCWYKSWTPKTLESGTPLFKERGRW